LPHVASIFVSCAVVDGLVLIKGMAYCTYPLPED